MHEQVHKKDFTLQMSNSLSLFTILQTAWKFQPKPPLLLSSNTAYLNQDTPNRLQNYLVFT
jgi:hypothetical protein